MSFTPNDLMRPYVAAIMAMQKLSDVPAEALAELRLTVLSAVIDDKPDVARARVLVAVLLQDLIDSDVSLRGVRR
jgi:hypothetical protein